MKNCGAAPDRCCPVGLAAAQAGYRRSRAGCYLWGEVILISFEGADSDPSSRPARGTSPATRPLFAPTWAVWCPVHSANVIGNDANGAALTRSTSDDQPRPSLAEWDWRCLETPEKTVSYRQWLSIVTNHHRRIAGPFPYFPGEGAVKMRWEVGFPDVVPQRY